MLLSYSLNISLFLFHSTYVLASKRLAQLHHHSFNNNNLKYRLNKIPTCFPFPSKIHHRHHEEVVSSTLVQILFEVIIVLFSSSSLFLFQGNTSSSSTSGINLLLHTTLSTVTSSISTIIPIHPDG